MRSDEVRALGELVGDAATGIADQVRDLHEGVAGRVFGLLGASARPVELVHDPIVASAHAGARSLTGAILGAAALIAGESRPADASSIHSGPRGRALAAVLNGAWGDRLAGERSALAVAFTLCDAAGRPVEPAALPDGPLAVFVHGLGETDRSWRRHGAGAYGPALSRHGITPLFARYNTGLSIADNAAALAAVLAQLPATGPPRSIALIGHSMGGLVIRATAATATAAAWRARLRAIVTLGTPHTGAPLARAAARAEEILSRLPETRPFAGPLRARSAGTRDLEAGSTLPFAPGVDPYFVSATITRDPQAPAGRLLGDLLVHRRSAWAQRSRTERLTFDDDHYRHLHGADHFALLGHPAVAQRLACWLVAPQVGPAQRP